MNNFHQHRGFSLIELMTVIVILGILASVAMPAYKDYVYSAKLADGYVGIEAISKAQKIYFQDKHYFTSAAAGVVSESCSCTPPYGGSKAPLGTPSGEPLRDDYNAWKALGEPLVDGTLSFFGYMTLSGGWDQGGSGYRSNTDSSAQPTFEAYDPAEFGPRIKISNTDFSEADGNCDSGLTGDSIGFTPLANRKVSLSFAAAPLKGVADQCTFIFQTLIADDDNIQTNAIVTIRE